ncbi:MAG: hypothetical protein F4Y12_08000 [Acidimicrobiaceae bacterium]|nr:hypothetical protein [Acidimicrobiaceae bacterium]
MRFDERLRKIDVTKSNAATLSVESDNGPGVSPSSTTTGHSRLEITLRAGSPQWSGRPLIERLAEIATKPAEATRSTLRMLKGAANDWDHLG